MKKSVLLILSLVLIVVVSGCIQTEVRTPSPQGMTKTESCIPNWGCDNWSSCTPSGTQTRTCTDLSNCGVTANKPIESQNCEYEIEQTENELIQNLSKIYNNYHSVNTSKIDCRNPEYYKTDLMNLSIKNWNNEYYKTQTAMWYPSLDEGRIGNVLFDLKNVGCTKIDPVYGSIVILNNKIVFSSSENKILLSDSMYPNGLYPEDWMMGNLPVSGNNFEPLTVKATGNYIVWIYVKNKNNNHMVVIDRINLTMS